jgi:hypothetical protein
MPTPIIEYRCLLISPSDVLKERDALTSLVQHWNAQVGTGLNARLELVRWESHATPDMSDTAQNVINAQLLESCDLGIAVFWSRLGTPTVIYPSGSIEEIYKLIQRGARVLVYFCSRPIPQEAIVTDQFARLQEMRAKLYQEGLLASYSDVANLREQVNLHLTNIVTQLLSTDRNIPTYVPSSGTLTAPTPDVRVTVAAGFRQAINGELTYLLAISVQNHSPVTVYLSGGVFIESRAGGIVVPNGDFLSNEYQKFREIPPGRSYTLNVDPAEIRRHMSCGLVCAAAMDDIGRVYRSSEDEFSTAMKILFEYYLKDDSALQTSVPGKL